MKFITISTTKDIYYTLPQKDRASLDAASLRYLIDLKRNMGDKMRFFSAPGGQAFSISEYDSVEQYSQSLRESPRAAAGFTNFECIPVVEMDEKALKAYEERAKAGK